MTLRVHFVVGTGRCGSSLLHEILCRHDQVDFISNLQDRSRRLGVEHSDYNNRLFRRLPPTATTKGRLRFAPSEAYAALAREVGPVMVDPYRDLMASDATAGLAARLQRFFSSVQVDDPERVVVHKFTGWPRARMLAEVFEQARFVHVVRDPRDVVSSWVRMGWWRGHHGPQGWHFGPLDADQHRLWSESGESFAVLAALGWQTLIDAAAECRRELGSSWLDIRYEDLCDNPEGRLREVLEHVGLGTTPSFSDQLSRYALDRRAGAEWPEIGRDLAAVEQVCARGMADYSYERAWSPSASTPPTLSALER